MNSLQSKDWCIYLQPSSFSSLCLMCCSIPPISRLVWSWKTFCAPRDGVMSTTTVSQQECSAADGLTEVWSEVEDWTDRWFSHQRSATTTSWQCDGLKWTAHDVQLKLLIKPACNNLSTVSVQCWTTAKTFSHSMDRRIRDTSVALLTLAAAAATQRDFPTIICRTVCIVHITINFWQP